MRRTSERWSSGRKRWNINGAVQTRWAWLIATFFGAGFGKPAPGTWGSAGCVVLYCALTYALGHGFWVALGIAVLATAVGIPAATIVAREFGREDPGLVVIDEVAGQALPLALAGLDWKYVLGAFLLFRAFDIVKPFPVRSLERLPEGTGIVVDDLGAGLYAALVLWGVQYFARYGTH